jgi:hypothetical protein
MSKRQAKKPPREDTLDACIRSLSAELEQKLQTFLLAAGEDANLTGAERRRLRSAGVRNYGFIDVAFDTARDNPEFMPANFNVGTLAARRRRLEDARQLVFVLEQLTQAASNVLLIQADNCYHDALRVYGSLHGQARSRVPGAEPLFQALRAFFSRRKRNTESGGIREVVDDVHT